jgi:hypothetical protein
MNVEPLFTVAMLLALVMGFAILAGALRRRDLAIGYCTSFYMFFCMFFYKLTERGPTAGPRIREIGRQDVHLLFINIKLPECLAGGARGCAA